MPDQSARLTTLRTRRLLVGKSERRALLSAQGREPAHEGGRCFVGGKAGLCRGAPLMRASDTDRSRPGASDRKSQANARNEGSGFESPRRLSGKPSKTKRFLVRPRSNVRGEDPAMEALWNRRTLYRGLVGLAAGLQKPQPSAVGMPVS